MLFVYPGKKSRFTNHSLYVVDSSIAPQETALKGMPPGEKGLTLAFLAQGLHDARTGIYGWESPYGALGSTTLSDGSFLLVEPTQSPAGEGAILHRYQWTGEKPVPFKEK